MRWRSNPSGKYSKERLTEGTVNSAMCKAENPPGCARCGAGACCSAIKYQSLTGGGGHFEWKVWLRRMGTKSSAVPTTPTSAKMQPGRREQRVSDFLDARANIVSWAPFCREGVLIALTTNHQLSELKCAFRLGWADLYGGVPSRKKGAQDIVFAWRSGEDQGGALADHAS